MKNHRNFRPAAAMLLAAFLTACGPAEDAAPADLSKGDEATRALAEATDDGNPTDERCVGLMDQVRQGFDAAMRSDEAQALERSDAHRHFIEVAELSQFANCEPFPSTPTCIMLLNGTLEAAWELRASREYEALTRSPVYEQAMRLVENGREAGCFGGTSTGCTDLLETFKNDSHALHESSEAQALSASPQAEALRDALRRLDANACLSGEERTEVCVEAQEQAKRTAAALDASSEAQMMVDSEAYRRVEQDADQMRRCVEDAGGFLGKLGSFE